MANVKVFADRHRITEKQTDGQTLSHTGKKLYVPNLSIRGHKK
jgi:hypothetical protein